MASVDFQNILLEQREEIALIDNSIPLQREKANEIDLGSNLAQVITGIRRCGKSTLAHMMLAGKDYAYVNFDDERLMSISVNHLNDLLEATYIVYGQFDYIRLAHVDGMAQELHFALSGIIERALSRLKKRSAVVGEILRLFRVESHQNAVNLHRFGDGRGDVQKEAVPVGHPDLRVGRFLIHLIGVGQRGIGVGQGIGRDFSQPRYFYNSMGDAVMAAKGCRCVYLALRGALSIVAGDGQVSVAASVG